MTTYFEKIGMNLKVPNIKTPGVWVSGLSRFKSAHHGFFIFREDRTGQKGKSPEYSRYDIERYSQAELTLDHSNGTTRMLGVE